MGDLIGWLIAIIWITAIVAVGFTLVEKFWWLILIVIAVYLLWRKYRKQPQQDKPKTEKKTNSSKVAPDNSSKIAKNKEISNVKLPNSVNYDDVMYYLNNKPSIMTLEHGKHINSQTGNPVLSARSIEQTKEKIQRFGHQQKTFRHLANLSLIDPQKAVKQYCNTVATPFFEGGLLAYQQGDYDLAEEWWLSVLDLQPFEVSQKLATLYRKQHRYKDMSDMYAVAINDSKKPYIHLRPNHDQEMVSEFMKASEKYLDKKDKDKSKGVKTYPSIIDMKFIDVLNGNKTSCGVNKQEELIGDK